MRVQFDGDILLTGAKRFEQVQGPLGAVAEEALLDEILEGFSRDRFYVNGSAESVVIGNLLSSVTAFEDDNQDFDTYRFLLDDVSLHGSPDEKLLVREVTPDMEQALFLELNNLISTLRPLVETCQLATDMASVRRQN